MNLLHRAGAARPTIISIAWLLSIGISAGEDQQSEIRVLQKDGLIELSTDGGQRWIRTDVNQRLRVGDRLRTGPNTRASLVWADSKVLTTSPLTEIEVIAPVASGEPGVHVWRGILWFFDRDQPGRARIKAAGAVAGVKGTEFVVSVAMVNGAAESTFSVVDGTVEVQNEFGSVTLSNAQQAVVGPGQMPRRTPGFVTENLLQWAFYYPGILNPEDLPFSDAEKAGLSESLTAYRSGDLLAALSAVRGRAPQSENESVYYAALFLSAGQVEESEALIRTVDQAGPSELARRVATALRVLMAAVKRAPAPAAPEPTLATELLAASFHEQSQAQGDATLRKALALAREAANLAPNSGFAWARIAELEFSFGNMERAMGALDRSLSLSPRNAQALTLRGFVLASRNQPREAIDWFDRAIRLDSFLANAWLGRGLCRIRRGEHGSGREDLLVAAALEPQRATLRSYLGKAYGDAGDLNRALYELELAQRMDPGDPTAWLYSALIKADYSRINEAIRDLERSQVLNDNRSLYRSRLLLDQDRAVRSADMAMLYDDAGLGDVALAEASHGIIADYANYSAHLFLANSYLIARETISSPRFQTAAASEFLLARILGPADGRLLAQSAGRNEPTMLFERDGLGFSSRTEYQSSGLWYQSAVQFGTYGNSSYAVQGDFLWDPGETPHREREFRFFSATFKHQVTLRDSLLLDIRDTWHQHENSDRPYDPRLTAAGFRALERQEPDLIVGWNHEWSPEHRTLFAASQINRSFDYTAAHAGVYLLTGDAGATDGFFGTDLAQEYEIESRFSTLEVQHLFATARTRTIVGLRGNYITDRTASRHVLNSGNASSLESYFGTVPGTVVDEQSGIETKAFRVSPYIYEHWQILDRLWLIAGISYDHQTLPGNTRFAPVADNDDTRQQLSPKAGFTWTPAPRWIFRGAYAQSLGGVELDENLRLEPVHLGGIIYAHANAFPSSLVGPVAGARSETSGLAVEHRWSSNTFVNASALWLRSRGERDVGAYRRDLVGTVGPNTQLEERLRFDELSGRLSIHQLIGERWTVGVRYEVTGAQFRRTHPTVSDTINFADVRTTRAVLHVAGVDALYRHPSGIFAAASADWWAQRFSASSGLLEDDFPFTRISLGYRFPRRRAELTVGVLNVTDQDYRLHPLNLYPELARERTIFTRLDLSF